MEGTHVCEAHPHRSGSYRYGTEAAVGNALRKSGVPRDQVFLTTKLWNNGHHPDDVEATLDASLKDLGTDHVDLYLIHWPVALERGDNLFPKDDKGKMKMADVDYVDVRSSPFEVHPCRHLLTKGPPADL